MTADWDMAGAPSARVEALQRAVKPRDPLDGVVHSDDGDEGHSAMGGTSAGVSSAGVSSAGASSEAADDIRTLAAIQIRLATGYHLRKRPSGTA